MCVVFYFDLESAQDWIYAVNFYLKTIYWSSGAQLCGEEHSNE